LLLKREAALTAKSWYEASVRRPPASPRIEGRIDADVCIVGGGYAGLSAALELRSRGYSVALLEAQRIGWGASGRNGGQVIAGYVGEDAVESQLPVADARHAWDVSVEGLRLLHQRIADHAIDCDYVPGYLMLATGPRKATALHKWVNRVADLYDYSLHWITHPEIGRWIASERFHAGAYDGNSGHLHPLKYCLGLARAATKAGVRIFESSPVVDVERHRKPVVKTRAGSVQCRFVVLAGNVYLGQYGKTVAPEIGPRIMPVGTYIVATEPMGKERADALIHHRAAVSDTNFVLDYFRPSADHRLLFGAGESYSAATPRKLEAGMRRRMLAVFPQLADLEIPYVWGGFVDITMNRAPDFGRVHPNIYYLQGFSGHGLALTGMAGKLVAETIAGQAERFDVFSRIRHMPFPGGALMRTPALALGMLYYRMRDLLD